MKETLGAIIVLVVIICLVGLIPHPHSKHHHFVKEKMQVYKVHVAKKDTTKHVTSVQAPSNDDWWYYYILTNSDNSYTYTSSRVPIPASSYSSATWSRSTVSPLASLQSAQANPGQTSQIAGMSKFDVMEKINEENGTVKEIQEEPALEQEVEVDNQVNGMNDNDIGTPEVTTEQGAEAAEAADGGDVGGGDAGGDGGGGD